MTWIGIDPGKHTGLAVLDGRSGCFVSISTLPLHRALEEVATLAAQGELSVIFEDARQRRWLPHARTLTEFKGRAMGGGSVRRDCTVWEEFLTDKGIPFRAVPPRPGMTKMDAERFARITGYKGRTSNHGRDAAMLVLGCR